MSTISWISIYYLHQHPAPTAYGSIYYHHPTQMTRSPSISLSMNTSPNILSPSRKCTLSLLIRGISCAHPGRMTSPNIAIYLPNYNISPPPPIASHTLSATRSSGDYYHYQPAPNLTYNDGIRSDRLIELAISISSSRIPTSLRQQLCQTHSLTTH